MLNKELDSLLNPKKNQLKGTIGMSRTVINVASRKGFVWVRLMDNPNELVKAHNSKVSAIFGLPVILEWDGYKYEILDRDVDRYVQWGSDSSFIPAHAGQHTAMRGSEGGDVVWIDSRQFLPMLVMPTGLTGSQSVNISPYPYKNSDNEWGLVGNTGTFNMPGLSTTGSNIYLLMLDDSNFGFYALTGTVFSNDITGTAGILLHTPEVPQFSADLPLCAIKTKGTDPILWDHIYDVRQFISNGAGGGMMFTGTGNNITDIFGDLVANGPGSVTGTIQPNAVTNSKLADMIGPTLKGRASGTGDPQDLTPTDVLTFGLGAFGGASEAVNEFPNGTGTHFTFTTPAFAIWVLADGVKQKDADVTYVPLTTAFDLAWPPPTGTEMEVIRLAPIVTPAPTHYILVREKQVLGANSSGNPFNSGAWRTRIINEEVEDTGGYCSIASNQITLAPGTYRYRAFAPGVNCAWHQLRLWNITTGALVPSSDGAAIYANPSGACTHAQVTGKFTITTTSVFEVQHRCGTTSAIGFGQAQSFGGVEVYAVAEFFKDG